MNLERHAKRLLNVTNSSDDDMQYHKDYDYKTKALKYKRDLRLAEELIKTLKKENYENKQLITELLLDLDDSKIKQAKLEQQLIEQQELTQSAVDQLQRSKEQNIEDRLLLEQKQFQERMTLQSNEAIEKLKQHFDQQISTLQTPQNKKKVTLNTKKSPIKQLKKK